MRPPASGTLSVCVETNILLEVLRTLWLCVLGDKNRNIFESRAPLDGRTDGYYQKWFREMSVEIQNPVCGAQKRWLPASSGAVEPFQDG